MKRVISSRRPQLSVHSSRLGHILNNKLIPNSLILLNNRPNVKGSALVLRAILQLACGQILCIDKRRDTHRLGLQTSHLIAGAKNGTSSILTHSSYVIIYRASLRRVFMRIHGRRPSIIIVSSVRAVVARTISDSPNDVSRIQRYTTSLLGFTGRDGIPIVLVKRVGGRKALTKPGILRRVISTMLRFRNSRRCVCHVLQDVGGHFKDATRLNVCRVHRSNLHRIDGPSRLLLARGRRKLDNITVTSAVRNVHPFLVRARTLIDATTCKAPRHSTANFSLHHLGVLLTILRGHINFGLTRGSIFLGVTNNLGIASPTVSLSIVTTILDDGISAKVRDNIYVTKRIKLDKRVHPIGHVRRHITRTTGLNFHHVVVPGRGLRKFSASGLGVRLIPMHGIRRTLHTLFKWAADELP